LQNIRLALWLNFLLRYQSNTQSEYKKARPNTVVYQDRTAESLLALQSQNIDIYTFQVD